jgi:hypothetical protein
MLKIIAIAFSLANPSHFAIFVSQAEYTMEDCNARLPLFEAALKAQVETKTGEEVAIKAECATPEAIKKFIEEMAAKYPDAKPGRGA